MGSKRFTEIGYQTIICDYLYEPVVLPRHFLQQLKQIIFWKCFTHHFIKLYTGEGVVGRLPFELALVLEMELITYFYFLSKWRVQKNANENPPPKFFIGFAAIQAALDHSTLTYFRERLFKRSKLKVSKAILEENFRMARSSGVQFGVIQIVHDPDARCRVKHKRKAKTKDGQEVEHTKATRIHLKRVLVDIHARDYACEDEEPKPDVLGMPSHILNSDSNPIAALSLAGPTRAIAPENKVTWSSLIIYAAAGIRYRPGYSHKISRRVGNV